MKYFTCTYYVSRFNSAAISSYDFSAYKKKKSYVSGTDGWTQGEDSLYSFQKTNSIVGTKKLEAKRVTRILYCS